MDESTPDPASARAAEERSAEAEAAPQRRVMRVFLSSTFVDFMEERELLAKRVFPALQRRAALRGVELVDVDLRWGVTEAMTRNGRTLPICLAAIDRCRPYFIGLLGERYGWVPPPDPTYYQSELLEREPWLKERMGGASVTELAWCRHQHGDADPGTLTSINLLAIDLRETGELEEAEALFRELLASSQQVLEPEDFQIGSAQGGLAKTLERAGKLEEALIYARQTLDHRLLHQGSDDWHTNRERLDLARVLHKLNKNPESISLLRELKASMALIDNPGDADRDLINDAEELLQTVGKQSTDDPR